MLYQLGLLMQNQQTGSRPATGWSSDGSPPPNPHARACWLCAPCAPPPADLKHTRSSPTTPLPIMLSFIGRQTALSSRAGWSCQERVIGSLRMERFFIGYADVTYSGTQQYLGLIILLTPLSSPMTGLTVVSLFLCPASCVE